MKLIQFNVYFGEYPKVPIEQRMIDICEIINRENVDVACLQEVHRDVYDTIVESLKDRYPYVYPDPDDGLTHAYGTVIFSRHKINNPAKHTYEFTSMGRDIKLVYIQNENGEKMCICTTHFESEFKNGCFKKKYQYDRCSDILHRIHMKKKIPVFLCADANVCKQSEHAFVKAFSYAKRWRDSWIEMGSPKDKELTFDSDTNPILLDRYCDPSNNKTSYRSRLDRVIHLSNMHTVKFELIGTTKDSILSDHYGIMCEFSEEKPTDRGEYTPHCIIEDRPRSKTSTTPINGKPKAYIPTKKLF